MFADIVGSNEVHPSVVRAQVVYQNYLCFVYLGESCFTVLKRIAPTGSVTKKCCKFLTSNPVRAFRNSIAHANWKYSDDFTSIDFMARKGSEGDEPMVEWNVANEQLEFWQALARCVGYVAYTEIER